MFYFLVLSIRKTSEFLTGRKIKMWTAAKIKNHIEKIDDDKLFSTRDFLSYGPRPAVDQTLWRLVNAGIIIRVARGLFIKKDAAIPSAFEVAKAKAEAFGRCIVTSGLQAARDLGLSNGNSSKSKDSSHGDAEPNVSEVAYATNGRTSSFRFGKIIIKLIGTSPRKLGLKDDAVNAVLRALWHHGKKACLPETISQATNRLDRVQRQELRDAEGLMPYWLQKCFQFFRKEPKRTKKKRMDFNWGWAYFPKLE
ncbi:MAG: hypothetical protein K2W82_07185 [Candidatus Obscuribacterales bacterium]|nr:hypothetical protein [Candidatus Obscuribacterales bacterium]